MNLSMQKDEALVDNRTKTKQNLGKNHEKCSPTILDLKNCGASCKKWDRTKLIIQALTTFFTGLCYCCWAENYAQYIFLSQAKFPFSFPLSTKQTMDNDAMDTNHSSLLAWISSIYFVFCLENYFHIFLYFLFCIYAIMGFSMCTFLQKRLLRK